MGNKNSLFNEDWIIPTILVFENKKAKGHKANQNLYYKEQGGQDYDNYLTMNIRLVCKMIGHDTLARLKGRHRL